MKPQPMSDAEIEEAAKRIAECTMVYPWEFLPEKARETMRQHARMIMFPAIAARDAQWDAMIGEPVAWARAWHIAKETPKKERNSNGNLAWPFKYKLLAVTPSKMMADDSPLYAIKETP